MQHVALGALVMLTENIDLKVGVANGTTEIVTKLEFDQTIMFVEFPLHSIHQDTFKQFGKNQFKTSMIIKDIFTKHHFL